MRVQDLEFTQNQTDCKKLAGTLCMLAWYVLTVQYWVRTCRIWDVCTSSCSAPFQGHWKMSSGKHIVWISFFVATFASLQAFLKDMLESMSLSVSRHEPMDGREYTLCHWGVQHQCIFCFWWSCQLVLLMCFVFEIYCYYVYIWKFDLVWLVWI